MRRDVAGCQQLTREAADRWVAMGRPAMPVACVLCEFDLPEGTPPPVITATMPGAVCATCGALSAAKRDRLRNDAMTRMLRASAKF